jgi:hypothetical protein
VECVVFRKTGRSTCEILSRGLGHQLLRIDRPPRTARSTSFFASPQEIKARFGGELIGGGYLVRRLLDATLVEDYFSPAAGAEVERKFDFFRQRRRIDRGGRAYAEFGLTWRR